MSRPPKTELEQLSEEIASIEDKMKKAGEGEYVEPVPVADIRRLTELRAQRDEMVKKQPKYEGVATNSGAAPWDETVYDIGNNNNDNAAPSAVDEELYAEVKKDGPVTPTTDSGVAGTMRGRPLPPLPQDAAAGTRLEDTATTLNVGAQEGVLEPEAAGDVMDEAADEGAPTRGASATLPRPPMPLPNAATREATPPLPPVSKKPSLPTIPEVDEGEIGLTDAQIRATANAAGVAEILDPQIEAARRAAAVVTQVQDAKGAAARYGEIVGIIGDGTKDKDEIKLGIDTLNATKGEVKDFPLNEFLTTINSFLGIEDEADRKNALTQAVSAYQFLADDSLSAEERLEKNIKAQATILGEEVTPDRAPDDQHPAPVGTPIKEDAKKKLQEDLEKSRKKFVKDNESSVSAKNTAVAAGKAGVCIGLCVAVPGFGILMSVAFLYVTRNYGNDDKLAEKNKKIEDLEKQAAESAKSGAIRPSFRTRAGEAAAQVAARQEEELQEEKLRLEAAGVALAGVGGASPNEPQLDAPAIPVVGAPVVDGNSAPLSGPQGDGPAGANNPTAPELIAAPVENGNNSPASPSELVGDEQDAHDPAAPLATGDPVEVVANSTVVEGASPSLPDDVTAVLENGDAALTTEHDGDASKDGGYLFVGEEEVVYDVASPDAAAPRRGAGLELEQEDLELLENIGKDLEEMLKESSTVNSAKEQHSAGEGVKGVIDPNNANKGTTLAA